MTDDRITVTVKEFCRLSGLGRRKVFEMCREGTIERVKLSPRHSLIVLASWQRFIDGKKDQTGWPVTGETPEADHQQLNDFNGVRSKLGGTLVCHIGERRSAP